MVAALGDFPGVIVANLDELRITANVISKAMGEVRAACGIRFAVKFAKNVPCIPTPKHASTATHTQWMLIWPNGRVGIGIEFGGNSNVHAEPLVRAGFYRVGPLVLVAGIPAFGIRQSNCAGIIEQFNAAEVHRKRLQPKVIPLGVDGGSSDENAVSVHVKVSGKGQCSRASIQGFRVATCGHNSNETRQNGGTEKGANDVHDANILKREQKKSALGCRNKDNGCEHGLFGAKEKPNLTS